MTEREYREAEYAFESYHPEAGSMSFGEYTEEPEFEEEFEYELGLASRAGGARTIGDFGRSHYVGSQMPYDASRMHLSREDSRGHGNGSSHRHGEDNLQRSGTGGAHETHSDHESLVRESGGVRAEGGRGGPSIPSEASNSHGLGSSAIGGNRRCGAPPPPSRRARFLSTRLGQICNFPSIGSRSHGNQQNSHSQARHVGYGGHGGSTSRNDGRRNPANDRQA